MLLGALLAHLGRSFDLGAASQINITGICEDSRRVRAGDLFVARPGTKLDGAKFLNEAQARGAVAAIAASPVGDCPMPVVVVDDVNAAASMLANALAGFPHRAMGVMGVTGTNGKTTTTYLIRHILKTVGLKSGLVGTVEVDDGQGCRESDMTTPSATQIASLLSTMRDNRCAACAMEVSSHALDQGRVAGIEFAGAAFTNLTGDHLDYHKTMANYAAAKAKLFTSLSPSAVAVVNDQDSWTERMLRDCRAQVIRFGFGPHADYRADLPRITANGSSFVLITPDGRAEVTMPLIGRHNIENALAAVGLAGELFGLSVHQLAIGLREATGAPGRLQPVRCGQPFAVLVDYAHTDDALENVLTALRPLTRGKLRVVFGCGGDRDRTKRPRMARTAERLADVVYVTSDNPRTENATAIIAEILDGFTASSRPRIVVEPDRRQAIAHVLQDAAEGDVVLLAGKGHENYQIIGTEKRHFDDAEEAERFLTARYATV